MKINEPVTGREIPMRDDIIIVSKTDLKGLITYANSSFIDIAGFSEAELIGKNHNMVRHPDMPAAAFQDIWDTVQAGKPWTGIVKNLAKSGDHYWVKANVTPVYENGQIHEYMSVRTKPTEREVQDAEILYRAINSGSYQGDSWLKGMLSRVANLRLMKKFYLVMAASFLLSGLFAWFPIDQADKQWHDYQSHVAKRQSLLSEMKPQFGYGGAIHNFKNYVLRGTEKYGERFLKNNQMLSLLLNEYGRLSDLNTEERTALTAIRQVADNYRTMYDKILPMVQAGESAQKIDGLVKVSDGPALDGFRQLNVVYEQLTQHRTEILDSTISSSKKITSIMPPLGFAVLFMLFYLSIKRGVLKPIEHSLGHFHRIAKGHYFDDIKLDRGDEIGDLFRGVKSMQTKLGYDVNEAREQAASATRIKTALDNVSSGVMMADNDLNIIYMNKSVEALFKNAEKDILKGCSYSMMYAFSSLPQIG